MDNLRAQILTLIQENWAQTRSGALPPIGDDDNLFDMGVVDSLMMMEIVALVEDECQTMIDFLSVDPEVFFTLRGIMRLHTDLLEGSLR
jgi:acyl carrier protein